MVTVEGSSRLTRKEPNIDVWRLASFSSALAVHPGVKTMSKLDVFENHPGEHLPINDEAGDPRPQQKTKVLLEHVETARAFKKEGNERYTQKEIRQAMRCYHKCLLYIRAVLDVKVPQFMRPSKEVLPAEVKEEVKQMRANCYNNLAACLLATPNGDSGRVITYCDNVLSEYPKNVKALYRKGVALYNLKNYDEAMRNLLEARHLVRSSDPDIATYINLCEQRIEEYKQQQKVRFEGMFQKSQQTPATGHPSE